MFLSCRRLLGSPMCELRASGRFSLFCPRLQCNRNGGFPFSCRIASRALRAGEPTKAGFLRFLVVCRWPVSCTNRCHATCSARPPLITEFPINVIASAGGISPASQLQPPAVIAVFLCAPAGLARCCRVCCCSCMVARLGPWYRLRLA